MRHTHPLSLIPSNGIIEALQDGLPLSTDQLAIRAGVKQRKSEYEYLSDNWRGKIYRNAARLERNGTLVSVKSYNGKTYERVWKLKRLA